MCTLNKQEILDEAKKIKFDVLEMCRLGAIDPVPENLVKLLYFTIKHNEAEKKEGKGKGESFDLRKEETRRK